MIEFHRCSLADKARYDAYHFQTPERGCEYSFANLYLWGRQEIAFVDGCVAFFSHFNGRTLYPFPIGPGDKQGLIEAILADARERGIPCRLTGMTRQDAADLEAWFPGRFQIQSNRDSFDYVYQIDALADLRGKKMQKKRNHFNRFTVNQPNYRTEPLTCKNLPLAQHMVNDWFVYRRQLDPDGDYFLESLALAQAFRHLDDLNMEGLVLLDEDRILGVTLGTRLSDDTFDIHFEKAREDVDGAYNAINFEFARYLRLKYPQIRYLNREDDLGLEGLRKAKLSYQPDHMVEKFWARLREDIVYED